MLRDYRDIFFPVVGKKISACEADTKMQLLCVCLVVVI